VQERSKSHDHCDGKANAEIVRVDPVRRRADGDIADILMHEVEWIATSPMKRIGAGMRKLGQSRVTALRRASRNSIASWSGVLSHTAVT
jgi:hypothetical protein